jgi:iron(III) transport system substrate-binding protein
MVVLPPEDSVTQDLPRAEKRWPRLGLFLLLPAALAGWIVARAYFNIQSGGEVIAYCAQDQTYAEYILREFQKATGIKVRAVYDSEAVKTVGIANRLLAERSHPQCDVFWGNEEMRARQLAQQGVFRETNGLAFFGYRTRCLVYDTGHIAKASLPHSLLELTNEVWRGKVAIAYPQFGTTAAHFHALRQRWGDAAWETWCRGLAANKTLLVDGNSVVVKMVANGEARVGLTDSDDVAAGEAEHLPVSAAPAMEEALLIPNAAAIVRGAPHPDAAQKLFDYLKQPATVQKLVDAHALEGLTISANGQPGLKVEWPSLLQDLETTTEKLNRIFLR